MRASRRRGRRGENASRSGADKFTLVGFAILLLASVMMMGAVHWYVVCVLTGIGCAATLSISTSLSKDWTPVVSVCGALALWSALSIFPIPLGVMGWLSPESAEIWSRSLTPLREAQPGWTTTSIDPIATVQEVAKWSFYACSALVAGRIARVFSLQHVLALLWSMSVLVALVTLFQALTQLSSVLGVYSPLETSRTPAASVLLNPNNLAGFLNLGTFCGIGIAISQRPILPIAVVASGTVVCVVTTFLSASRGGVGMLLLGLISLGLLQVARLRRGRTRESFGRGTMMALLPLVAGLISAGVLIAVSVTATTWQELFKDDLSKLQSIVHLKDAISDFWLFGVGRGGFETISFRYLGADNNVVYRSVENFVASWVVEWGAPVALAALGSFFWLLRPRRLGIRQHPPAQAALVGVIVLAGQNLVDLGLEVLSITAATFALLGALESTRHQRRNQVPEPSEQTIVARLVPALGLIAAVTSAFLGPDVFTLRHEMARWVESVSTRADGFAMIRTRLISEMKWRPAEAYFPILGAAAAAKYGDNILPWAAAALERAPGSARANLAAAEGLLQHKAMDQAALHFKKAMSVEPTLASHVTARLTAAGATLDQVKRAAPPGATGAKFLLTARAALPPNNNAEREELLSLAVQLAPTDENVLSTQGFTLLEKVRLEKQPCNGSIVGCSAVDPGVVKEIHNIASRLSNNSTCNGLRMRSRLLDLQGKTELAVDTLAACVECRVPLPCATERVILSQRSENPEQRRAAEATLLSLGCGTAEQCATSETLLASLAAKRKEWGAAYSHYVRAASRVPSYSTWIAATKAAARSGQLALAEVAYEQAKRSGPRDPEAEQLLRSTRNHVLNPNGQ